MGLIYCYSLIFYVICQASLVKGQDVYLPEKINSEVLLDGISDEPFWQEIEPLPMSMYLPVFGNPPTEKTEIRVVYDNSYIYVSGKLYASSPNIIQGNSLIRDKDLGGDFFNILIDSYNDNENVLAFSTTPTGNRIDSEIPNDAEGLINNISWNAFWDTKSVVNESGWFVEVKIPFFNLKFNADEDNNVIMGLTFHRLIGKKSERLTFPDISPDNPVNCWKASKTKHFLFKGIIPKKPIFFTPYTLLGFNKNDTISSSDLDLGVDMKLRIGNNTNLDLTYNTDFAQVEADEARVNLSRFSLLFPEKRQFFIERSGVFSFNTNQTRIFHSRRIGIDDTGSPIPIYGGARMVGRYNKTDIGFLNMQSRKSTDLPSENFTVFRAKQNVINNNSYIGTIFTSRLSKEKANLNYGLDGTFRVAKNDFISFKWAKTEDFVEKTKIKNNLKNSSLVNLLWERRTSLGFSYRFEVERQGDLFNPNIGFTNRSNYTFISPRFSYTWLAQNSSKLREWVLIFINATYYSNKTRNVTSETNSLLFGPPFKSGADLWINIDRYVENVAREFPLSQDVSIPIDKYLYYQTKLNFQSNPGKNLSFYTRLTLGKLYDGSGFGFTFTPNWIFSRYLSLIGSYNLTNLNFKHRNQEFRSHVLTFGTSVAANSHLSINVLTQYISLENRLSANIRIRYNFKEGHDLYVVYNNSTLDNQQLDIMLNSLYQSNLTLKYSYTFIRERKQRT